MRWICPCCRRTNGYVDICARIPTKEYLGIRHRAIEIRCPWCGEELEKEDIHRGLKEWIKQKLHTLRGGNPETYAQLLGELMEQSE